MERGDDGHQDVTTEQLFRDLPEKETNEEQMCTKKILDLGRWKKLDEKGAVHILTGDSAEKAKAQFANRFSPNRFVVTRPCPEEFKARWCLRGYLDPDVMELVGSGSTQSRSWDECFLVR